MGDGKEIIRTYVKTCSANCYRLQTEWGVKQKGEYAYNEFIPNIEK